jgi:2-oxopent-4-enoate/cis-2-oxohex-4-enoate hydratase
MSSNKPGIASLADELFQALIGCYALEPLALRHPELSIEDAYAISLALLERRIARGETVIGKKIGVTSKAVQDMLGVYQPDFGFLTNAMRLANNSQFCIHGQLIQPRAEAEIAFRMAKPLEGPDIDEQDVLAATDCVLPCFEIVDSRIRDWKITIIDTVADNASCGVFVLGDSEIPIAGLDLADLEVVVHKNGKFLSAGKGAAAMGSPLSCVAWLARTLTRFGTRINAGDIVLSGSLVPLEPARAGDHFSLDFAGKGSASVHFV